jgi:two-component system, NarL family, sensor histidine kinase UhpB
MPISGPDPIWIRATLPGAMKKPSLLSQVLGINVLLVTAAVLVASVAAGLDLSIDKQRWQFLDLALAIGLTLLVNAWLLRKRFRPLEQLIETMERVDLSRGGVRAEPSRGESAEVMRLHRAFNLMLDRLEEERRQSANAVLQAQEQERRRVAQDLHDEVNQALTAVLLRLEATAHEAPPALRRELADTQALANQAMEELLALARQLRPTALDDHGLIPALHTQVRDFAERTGIHADFKRRGTIPPLTADEQLVIYRVVQESLSNVAQHAGAGNVDVELSFVGRTVLRISDDGHGFSDGRPGGLGVSGMKERALLVGGRLLVHSLPGHGTVVELTMRDPRRVTLCAS